MATTEFLPVAAASGAEVDTQIDFAGSGYQVDGFTVGPTDPAQLNKVLRQATAFSAAWANFILGILAVNVPDDGNQPALTILIADAIAAAIAAGIAAAGIVATPASALAIMPGRAMNAVYGPTTAPTMVTVMVTSDGGPGANSDIVLMVGPSGSLVAVTGNGAHNGGGNMGASGLIPEGYYYELYETATGDAHTDTLTAWSEVALTLS